MRYPPDSVLLYRSYPFRSAYTRTPILTSGVSAARQSFEAAPKDITSEYDQSFIEWHMDLMTRTAEDPALVVEELVNACTV